MIRDAAVLRKFEDDLARSEKPDFLRNLKMAESFFREAVRMGVFPRRDPMEGIEPKLLLAKAINHVR